MLLKRAMRYYRLWIYVCNVALLASVVGFACVAGRTLADPRRALIPAVRYLYQPTFLYAYLALIAQGGAVQVLGCLGALRLNERLLELYWLFLFLLLCGDVLIGLSWILRFDQICAEIKPSLQQRLVDEYSSNADFTDVWDSLQRSAKCCGVAGPRDFLPLTPQSPGEGGNNTTIVVPHNLQGWWGWSKEGDESVLVPQSCCRPVMIETTTVGSLTNETLLLQSRQRCEVFSAGCEQHLVRWLRTNADLLFVIGYCVVAFVKLSFLGILHYEIREMIQKIKLMQQEREAFANSGADLTLANHYQALPTNLPPSPVHMNHLNHAPATQPTPMRSVQSPAPAQPQPATQQQTDSLFGSSPPTSLQAHMLSSPSQFSRLPNHVLRCAEDGNNSDTGSHCALISLDCKSSSFENNNKDTTTSRQTQI